MHQPVRLLIVDDDVYSRLLIRRRAESWGYVVETADDGKSAWEILSGPNPPQLAIIDWMMPKMEGVEVCRRLSQRVNGPFIYLIIFTVRNQPEDMHHALDSGAHDFLSKPVSEADLRCRLGVGRRLIEAEAERDRLAKRLHHASKVESLGIMAAGIAHDFNNILQIILGNTQLAQMKAASVPAIAKRLESINGATERAAEMTALMLAYAGSSRLDLVPTDLTDLITSMLPRMRDLMPPEASLSLELGEGLPACELDIGAIHQALINIVANAAEALGDSHGTVTIRTSFRHCDMEYLSVARLDETLDEGPYLLLEVRDTGCGMDRETRERIFDPFFSTKFMGRGLGLAAVWGIVRAHRGALHVDSEPGQGTAFTLLFPSTDRPAMPISTPPVNLLTGWRGSGSVLIVDDQAAVRYTANDMLRKLGFDPVCAPDGETAIRLFKASPPAFVAVLLDLCMPRMTGEEVLVRLREIDPNVKVILTSGFDAKEVAVRAEHIQANAFLHKPYRFDDLLFQLRQLVDPDQA